MIGGEAVGIVDDDGEVGGEAFEEGFEGGREVVMDVGGNKVGGDGFEEEGGGG